MTMTASWACGRSRRSSASPRSCRNARSSSASPTSPSGSIRRREGYDPLHAFIALFENRVVAKAAKKERPAAVEERLKQRIIDGDRLGLEEDLALAMEKHKPLDIINTFLLDGMKVVGELFGAGKMQLPFVLQSAETMKAAVNYLEPYMERVEGQQKGTIVLATVRGDV